MRRSILRSLYVMALDRPVSKQELADKVKIGYHQLSEFWKVEEERKVRGTRLELIAPTFPSTIFITLGWDGKIIVVDPLANLFGPLARVVPYSSRTLHGIGEIATASAVPRAQREKPRQRVTSALRRGEIGHVMVLLHRPRGPHRTDRPL